MKKLILSIILTMCLCSSVQATGLTIWGITEQVSSVNSDNAITGRIGYMLGVGDAGGLEPFVGSVWRPKESTPQVIVVGAVQHLADLVDPNSSIPYIPALFASILNEDVEIRPYIGAQCTINLIDKDSGFIGLITGITVKLEPDAKSELVFELSYDKMFNDLEAVPDNEFKGYAGVRIPF